MSQDEKLRRFVPQMILLELNFVNLGGEFIPHLSRMLRSARRLT